MMPLNYVLRKYTGPYNFTKPREKINPLTYIDDIRIFANDEKNSNRNKINK